MDPMILDELANHYGVTPDELASRPDLDQLYAQYESEQGETMGDDAMVAPETPEITVQPQARGRTLLDLSEFYNQYEDKPTNYTPLIEAEMQTSRDQQKKLEDAVRSGYAQDRPGPSKSELYFNIAQAFLDPGKTGNFTEGLGRAAGVGGAYRKEQRAAEAASRDDKRDAEIALGKLALGSTRENLAALRSQDTSARAERREVLKKMLSEYVASGQPQSTIGKILLDGGYVKGSPEYNEKYQELLKAELARRVQTWGSVVSNTLTPAQIAEEKLPPGTVAQKDSRGKIDVIHKPVDTTSPKIVPQKAIDDLAEQAGTAAALGRLVTTFKPEYGGNIILGQAENVARTTIGDSSGQGQWWQDYNYQANQIRNKLFGSALTAPEKAAFEAATITPRMDSGEIEKNLKRQQAAADAATRKLARATAKNYRNPEVVQEAVGGIDFENEPTASAPTKPVYADPEKQKRYEEFKRKRAGATQ